MLKIRQIWMAPVLGAVLIFYGLFLCLNQASADQCALSVQQSRGESIYRAKCQGCHYANRTNWKAGPGLKGLFSLPRTPALGRRTSADAISRQIITGGRGMPSFGYLKPAQLKDLLSYLKTL